jgi:HK97 family phage major capsid protein
MNTHPHHNMAGRAVCAVPAGIEVKERDGVAEIRTAIDGYARSAESGFRQLTDQSEKTAERVAGLDARMNSFEQKAARSWVGGDSSGFETKTLGQGLVEDERFQTFRANGGRGHYRFEHKTITSASNSGGATVAQDYRPEIVRRPETRLTVRDLCSQATTTSNLVQVPRELVFTNNAAVVVAEAATKPTSELTFELLEVSVRTVAHMFAMSRQILDDSSQLQSTVDAKARWGLGIIEEQQLLLGSGVGENINGLVLQATAYDDDADVTGDTMPDTILHAITQVEIASQLPVDGIVVLKDPLILYDGKGFGDHTRLL